MTPAASKGGVAQRSAKWAREFIRTGHDVTLVFWEDLLSPYSSKVQLKDFTGIPTVRVKYDSLNKVNQITKTLLQQIEFPSDSIVISGAWRVVYPLVNEARRGGKNIVLLDSIVGDDETNYLTAKFAAPICNAYITLGNRIKLELKKRLPEEYKNKRIHSSCPGSHVPETFPKFTRSTTLKACYVGRLDPLQKRIYDLVEIATGLHKKGVDFHFDVIGGGEHQKKLEAQCQERDISSKVTFHGRLPFERVQEKLAENEVFLLPSAFEGFSGALCEAMAAGLIPVATRISGTEDIVSDKQNGSLHEVGDISGFVETLGSLQGNFEELERLSKNSWESARNELSVTSVVSALVELMDEMIASPVQFKPGFSSQFGLLNSPWIPNSITRMIRKSWRAYRGKPSDVSAESWKQSKGTRK